MTKIKVSKIKLNTSCIKIVINIPNFHDDHIITENRFCQRKDMMAFTSKTAKILNRDVDKDTCKINNNS